MFAKRLTVLVPLVLAAAIALAGCGGAVRAAGSPAAQETEVANPRVINVSGSGRATAAPDVAYVTLGVESRDADAAAAVADNTARMQAVMDVLTNEGMAPEDIQTVSYQMWLEQAVNPKGVPEAEIGQEVEERYHVTNQVRATVRDLEGVGTVLQKALAAGANSVAGITFAVENTTTLRREARNEAIGDAKAKADQLAAGLGATVGAVQSVSEYGGGSEPAYAVREAYGMGGGGGVPVSSGELAVAVEIQVSFLIVE